MDVKDILCRCDHTLLTQGATWAEIRALCDDGVKYGCASVCIPASYVARAAEYLHGRLPVCTVIFRRSGGTVSRKASGKRSGNGQNRWRTETAISFVMLRI